VLKQRKSPRHQPRANMLGQGNRFVRLARDPQNLAITHSAQRVTHPQFMQRLHDFWTDFTHGERHAHCRGVDDCAHEATIRANKHWHDVMVFDVRADFAEPLDATLLHVAKINRVVDVTKSVHIAPAHGHHELMHHWPRVWVIRRRFCYNLFGAFHRGGESFEARSANYNRTMYSAAPSQGSNDTPTHGMPDGKLGVSNVDVAAAARANATDDALRIVPVGSEAWPYCRELAQLNMTPYLTRRGQAWNGAAWDEKAPSREFLQLFAAIDGKRALIGFVSLWHDRDKNSLHVGDIQLEGNARNHGFGAKAIERIVLIARSRGLSEITLNVFRDNPAIRLYERCGFKVIDHGFDKFKMMKELSA
jgi:ribosomal protein S18 acetylase RimI-like enzyme